MSLHMWLLLQAYVNLK
jgi:hypothetical protein